MSHKKGVFALSPLFVFLALYLVTSIVAGDFYKVPISVAFMFSSIYAVATYRGKDIHQRVQAFSSGAGAPGIMLMLWIFILASAFAASAKQIGCVDATVNAMLTILPHDFVLPGLFLATCFISMAIGTSVGCIVALVPIAAGMATNMGGSIPFYTAIVVGGAFFGDNLSFISDTTIAATTSQGCKMNDKFKANAYIAFPTALIVFIIYAAIGTGIKAMPDVKSVDIIKIIPYMVVILTAMCGLNVMLVLTIGIILTGIIGLTGHTMDVYEWMSTMGNGIMGMGELIIITMLAGGMFEIVKRNGGIDYIIQIATKHVHGRKGGELVIGSLVALIDLCTANNTVAIITMGGIAHGLSEKYGIENRRVASILDTFSCVMQGIIPYGAQILMASGLAHIMPVEMMPYLYYPYLLGGVALLSILFSFPRTNTQR